MYASFGLSALLKDQGISPQIVGGDFMCAVVSKDGSHMALQGFAKQQGGAPSHYWVEASGMLLDLGPTYLPCESSFPAAALPLIRWPVSSKLPPFIVYRERGRFDETAVIDNPTFRQKKADFVSYCREVGRLHTDISLDTWQLRDLHSLRKAAIRGEMWARAAIVFLQRGLKAEFPF